MASTQFLVLSEADADQKFEVQVNGLTVVVLEDNSGSTGYVWRYEEPTGTPGRLEPLNDSVLTGRQMPGAPGGHVFLLGAAQAGPTPLQFGLYSPGRAEAERNVSFEIEIVPAD